MQMIKESFLPAFAEILTILRAVTFAIEKVGINSHILDDPKYNYLFSVNEVNRLVLSGVPFRDAYKMVGKQIEEGSFNPDKTMLHTHEGSIGNLCNDKIADKFNRIFSEFDKNAIEKIKASLLLT
jgi:argininosuccinate lyase